MNQHSTQFCLPGIWEEHGLDDVSLHHSHSSNMGTEKMVLSRRVLGSERRLGHSFLYILLLRHHHCKLTECQGLQESSRPTKQKCRMRLFNKAVLLANQMGRDLQGWTGKCFALFVWRTGWWCRRLEPSTEWIENGLKECVQMLNWCYRFTVAFSENWGNDASCCYWNQGDTSNTCKNACAMENVVINETEVKIRF